MILLIEPDKTVKKKLCDLLNKERVIGVDSVQQSLEVLCKFKSDLNVIILNIHLLREILSNQIVFRLCQKLCFDTPPILGIYKNSDKKIKEEFEKDNKQYRLIEYNEKDYSFPGQFIQAMKEIYPGLNADIEKARESWKKEERGEDLTKVRKWMKEEGLYVEEAPVIYIEDLKEEAKKKGGIKNEVAEKIADIEESGLLTEEPEKEEKITQRIDVNEYYKKLYFKFKKKYDELLKYVKELMDTIENQ